MNSALYGDGIKELAASRCCPNTLPQPDLQGSADNPFCGDRVDTQVNVEAGRITALAHTVRGCMLCHASANVVAQSAVGLSQAEIASVASSLQAMLSGEQAIDWVPDGWEALALFEPVQPHKSRHGCVRLPFTALLQLFP